jgi:hypothetical protein
MRTLLSALAFSFLMVSCLTKPNFPFEPSISFSNIIQKTIKDENGIIVDSLILEINFKDGNGDIGLTSSDTTGNFAPFKPDGSRNPFYYNYYCTLFRRNKFTGEYQRFPMPKIPNTDIETNLHGRVPPLLENARPSPIEGKLQYQTEISTLYNTSTVPNPELINKNDSIRFEIFIYDRALNKSNVITTKSILVNP